MAETAAYWQSVGTPLKQDLRYVTHIGPDENELPADQQNSTSHHRSSFKYFPTTKRNSAGSSQVKPVAKPRVVNLGATTLGATQLTRTLSRTSSLKLHRGPRLTVCGRFGRFLGRFNWRYRSKGYPFGKAYLQRQPSFVVTPDRSSYTYSYRTPDMMKRRPKPRAWRTSQPVNTWKNPRPLDVLANNGKVDPPPFGKDGNASSGTESRSRERNTSDPQSSYHTGPTSPHRTGGGGSSGTNEESVHRGPVGDKPALVKISLPVKHHRTSSASNTEPLVVNAPSTPPLERDENPNTSTSSSGNQGRSSLLDSLPRTPVQTLPGREHSRQISDEVPFNFASSNDAKPTDTSKSPSQIVKIQPLSAPGSSQSRSTGSYGTPGSGNTSSGSPRPLPTLPLRASALAQTLDNESAPPSPTSLPSTYRPESWRRSAIIARNSLVVDPYNVDEDGLSEEVLGGNGNTVNTTNFADMWSAFLRRAIAQRAISSREQKSVELRNELRWSRNMQWESDPELLSQTSIADTNSSVDFEESNFSLNSASSDSSHVNPTGHGSPASREYPSSHPYGPYASLSHPYQLRSAYESRPASYDTQIYEPSSTPRLRSSPSDEGTKSGDSSLQTQRWSRLAPLHSPRAMAAASQTQLEQLKRRQSGELRTGDAITGSDIVDPTRFSRQVEGAPMRYTALFANSRGEGLETPWLRETNASSSSLSEASSSYASLPDRIRSRSQADSKFDYGQEDLNFGEQNLTNKRRYASLSPGPSSAVSLPLDEAPSLPVTLPVPLSSEQITPVMTAVKTMPLDTTAKLATLTSEPASAIVRNQSKLRKNPSQKRAKSSGSTEHLLHTRQMTMESLWAEESDDSRDEPSDTYAMGRRVLTQ